MNIKKISLAVLVLASLAAIGCGDPEVAGDVPLPDTGMMRVVNLSSEELAVKFGSQLNHSPLAPASGTRWQKQRVGAAKVGVLKGESSLLDETATVSKGQMTSFIILPADGGAKSVSVTESGDIQTQSGPASLRVIYTPSQGSSKALSITAGDGSKSSAEPLTPQTISVSGTEKQKFVFETEGQPKLEQEIELEAGSSYTIFLTEGKSGLVSALVRNDQKLEASGEAGSSR